VASQETSAIKRKLNPSALAAHHQLSEANELPGWKLTQAGESVVRRVSDSSSAVCRPWGNSWRWSPSEEEEEAAAAACHDFHPRVQ